MLIMLVLVVVLTPLTNDCEHLFYRQGSSILVFDPTVRALEEGLPTLQVLWKRGIRLPLPCCEHM